MIILIFGAPCMGKSLLANNLAERLNISNVLQTDIVEMVMRSIDPLQFANTPPIQQLSLQEMNLEYRKVLPML